VPLRLLSPVQKFDPCCGGADRTPPPDWHLAQDRCQYPVLRGCGPRAAAIMTRPGYSDAMAAHAALSGAALGALIGAAWSSASYLLAARRAAAEQVLGEAPHLQRDLQLSELISRFRPLGAHSGELRLVYARLVDSCDRLLRCHDAPGARRGSTPFKANRLAYQAKAAAVELCERAFAEYRDDSAPAMLREIENLEGLTNNHLHNIMLRSRT